MRKIFTIALLLCSFFSRAQTFNWSGYSLIQHDVNDTIIIPVTGLSNSINHDFGIAGVCFDILHGNKTSLWIMLVAPDGQSVLLTDGHGAANQDFIGTCFGMDGVPIGNGTAPFTGNWLPSGDINTLNNGQNPNGNWLLVINDHHGLSTDTGSIRFASINFTTGPPLSHGTGGTNTGPSGPFVKAGLVCPGGASSCDLLPDMTASALHIQNGYTEFPGRIEISNATPNIGYGPIEIYGMDSCFCNGVPSPCNAVCPDGSELQHIVRQRIYRKRPGTDTLDYYDRNAGTMTFHPTHGHLHVDGWASFTLRTATADPDPRNWPIVSSSVKQSFCLTNLGTCAGNPGECVDNNGNTILTVPNNNFGFQTGCDITQGIWPGLLDVYNQSHNEPILVDNICNGTYYLVSITDPDNQFLESDETNNWAAVPITLTQQQGTPVISSSSPYLCESATSITLTASVAPQYQWSNGATTRSIVVTDTGTYSVATPCGSSAPFTVSGLPANARPSVSIAVTAGSIPTCPGNAISFVATPVYGGTAPTYVWKVDGASVGTNSPAYTHTNLINGQQISCTVTSGISCLANNPVSSDSIRILVMPIDSFETQVTQIKGHNPFCAGDTVSFLAEAVLGINPEYHWKVNGQPVGTNSPEFSSNSLVHGQLVTCTIKATPVCGNEATIGTSTGFNNQGSTSGAAYPTWYGNVRAQYLIRASELLAMGLSAGAITGIGFITGNIVGDPAILNNYSIKLAQVAEASLSTNLLSPAFTTVYGPVDYEPMLNDTNKHTFSNSFIWNGVSNLLVDICYTGHVVGQKSYVNRVAGTAFISGAVYERDGNVPNACDTVKARYIAPQRPLMIFSNSSLKEISSSPIVLERLEPVYHFTGTGNWNIAANWEQGKVPPTHVLHCAEIIIDPAGNGECILNTNQVVSPGARITVVTGKKFRVVGDVLVQQ